MYAVIETGGKQYRVSPGQTVEVELLPAEPGTSVELDRVLLVSSEGNTQVGQPVVGGAKVFGTVAREGRAKKILVFKYKSKKRYRHALGHRQDYTYLLITDIQADGKSLVSADDRKRYEEQAARAAGRYQAKVAAILGALVESSGEEDLPREDIADEELDADE
ncbi:MAG: 50S ribosomal protein L21 [Ktedonobacterales bacterium]